MAREDKKTAATEMLNLIDIDNDFTGMISPEDWAPEHWMPPAKTALTEKLPESNVLSHEEGWDPFKQREPSRAGLGHSKKPERSTESIRSQVEAMSKHELTDEGQKELNQLKALLKERQ